ncbi:unnamed protein product [Larinioides sclopetarius]|uniref:NADH dehydrogenase subunit 1 n=1 Tax=Larinioides sclopetarius TaxID=280406 RepID=A0AAV2AFI9_9ARAC
MLISSRIFIMFLCITPQEGVILIL